MAKVRENKFDWKQSRKNISVWKVIILILVVVFAVVIFFVARDLRQEKILVQEVEQLVKKDFYTDEFLVDVHTRGEYAIIEKEIKLYFKEIADIARKFEQLEDDEELINILTIARFKEDGPNFSQSLEKIANVRKEVGDAISRFTQLCTRDYMDSLISKYDLDAYYVKLFEDLMYGEDDLKELQETHDELVVVGKSFEVFLDDCENILNFLKKNSGQWVIENDAIIFRTDALLTEYKNLSEKLLDDSNF